MLPDPDVPAPPRFLPDFDNLVLADADRTRIMDDEVRRRVCIGSERGRRCWWTAGSSGAWAISRAQGGAVLDIETFTPIPRAHQDVEGEGRRLLAFLAREEDHDIRMRPSV